MTRDTAAERRALADRLEGGGKLVSPELRAAVEGVPREVFLRPGVFLPADDGLFGHPRRAPYDKVIVTCAVRRIPYTWVRQTAPGGTILATVGSWPYGTGLAKVTVADDGTAEGRFIGRSSFMPARSRAVPQPNGDFSARTAYADTERRTSVPPGVLEDWAPAFLAQLAAPGAQLVTAVFGADGGDAHYLFDSERESFAELTEDSSGWTVRQGGPVALWDAVENALTAWQEAGRPDIGAVRMRVTERAHTYWIDGAPALRWEHPLV